MQLSQIQGTWTLDSFQIEDPSGAVTDWGSNAHGLLIYAPTGHMSVSINKDIENDPEQNDAQNVFDSVLFYSGTYYLDGNTIKHQVTQASNPARIGREMLRHVEFEQDLMKMVTPREKFGRAFLNWKKVKG